MSKLEQARNIDLAERAAQLSKEAEELRAKRKAGADTNNGVASGADKTIETSVQNLRKLAQR